MVQALCTENQDHGRAYHRPDCGAGYSVGEILLTDYSYLTDEDTRSGRK
jgi:hypothetical protein